MPDPNPNPTPLPPVPDKKAARERSEINQAWLDEISGTEKLAVVAGKTDYATLLVKRKIDSALLTKLTADLKQARKLVSTAIGKTTGKKAVTRTEKELHDDLITEIQSLQAAAKQKYFATNKPALADYYFGKNIQSLSRSKLETCATNIHEKAATADLPGIGADELKALEDALTAYTGVETAQSDEQSKATGVRSTLENLVGEIVNQRRQIQFAADGLWPAGKKENAGIRREFGLPPDKAFKG